MLAQSTRFPAAAQSQLARLPALGVRTAIGLSFGTVSAAIVQCAGAGAKDELAQKLQEIETMKTAIAQRAAEWIRRLCSVNVSVSSFTISKRPKQRHLT